MWLNARINLDLYKQLLLLSFSVIILLCGYVTSEGVPPTPTYGRYTAALHCNREPQGVTTKKTPGDNGFKIRISGNPEKYVPGEVYTGKIVIDYLN